MVRTEERRGGRTPDGGRARAGLRRPRRAQISSLAEEASGPSAGTPIAFARYEGGAKPFHRPRGTTSSRQSRSPPTVMALRGPGDQLAEGARSDDSITTATMASESYGYRLPPRRPRPANRLPPSSPSRLRVNAVRAGLLKTRSSAGIPGYADAWLFAEQRPCASAASGPTGRPQQPCSCSAALLRGRGPGIVVTGDGVELLRPRDPLPRDAGRGEPGSGAEPRRGCLIELGCGWITPALLGPLLPLALLAAVDLAAADPAGW